MTPERWARLKELFGAALEAPPQDRRAMIERVRSDEASLAAALVNLLRYHDATLSLLDAPAMTLDRLDEIAGGSTRAFAAGEVIAGRFRITRFIAEGGMGEVYAAEDLELHDSVALKTVRPVLARDASVLASFRQEIQLARRVTHRNVSRVFDLFRHEPPSGPAIVFLSMELLEGETLANHLRRQGAMPVTDAWNVARQLIAGLDAAHASGVIHRDFKSANVMLVDEQTEAGPTQPARVVITDFGLAAPPQLFAREGAAVQSPLAGTPAYMAPEQRRGGSITTAVDVYALGIVLYEMITGRFAAEVKDDLPLMKGVAAPLSWKRTIRACLADDPRRRPASAREVADRLTGARARRRGLQIATSLAVVALSAGGLRYWAERPYRPAPEAQRAADSARVKRENVTGPGYAEAVNDLKRATAIDPQWPDAWADLAYTYAAGANGQQIPGALARREARVAALKAVSLDRKSARGYGTLGWVQSLSFDDWPDAEANLRHAIRIDAQDPQFHYWLGVHLRKQGRFAEAEAEDRDALTLSHQADPSIWCELAFLYWTSGQLGRMRSFMGELLVAYPNFGLARYLNARLLKEEGQFDQALDELRFSQRLQYSPVTILAEQASVLAYRNDVRGARAILDQLVDRSQTSAVDTLLVAGVYAKLGDATEAFRWLERGFEQGDSTLLSVPTSPVLKPLRRDPRFADLLRRLRFDPPQIMQRVGFN
jgi:tetratricopeptide (TPR) repeat protein